MEGRVTDAAEHAFLKVRVRAVPEKGQANKAIIGLLAQWLDVAKSNVALVRGETDRLKTFRIAGAASQAAKLEQLFGDAHDSQDH